MPVALPPARPLEFVRYLLFAARCAGAAALSQVLAEALNFTFPVWAALSALVVSQERLEETRSSLSGRLLGTVVGMALAVAVHGAARWLPLAPQGQVTLAVAVGAVLARRYPRARACMWTAAIVLLAPADNDGMSIPQVALARGTEVTLGCLVGGAAHFGAEKLLHVCQRLLGR